MVEDFKINGNKYHLLEQNEKGLLWEATTVGGHVFWEVWLRRLTKVDFTWPNGKTVLAGSLIKPSEAHFGQTAWCLMSRDRAEAKYIAVCN